MLSQGFRASGAVDDRDLPLLLGEAHGFNQELGRLRYWVRAHILATLPNNPWAGVMVALVVGDQSLISQNSWNLFWQTGVGHLMSISGLHITLLAGLVASGARLLYPEIRWVTSVRWLAALGYSLLAGFSIPTQRTLYMIAVASLPSWLQVRLGLDKSLLLALTAALLVDPWAVLEPGFWLSFGAVAALLLSDAHQQRRGSLVKDALRSQWVATWAMIPLLVLLFQQVSLVSPLANALAIPVVSLGVVPLALAGTLPGFGWLLQGATMLFSAVMSYLEWLVALPFTLWSPPQPSWVVFLLSLGGLAFLLGPRGLPGRWVGSLALLPLLFSARPVPQGGGVWMDVLDVGQGLAVVVRTHEHVLVYDTGPRYSDQNDGSTRALLPALRAMGVHSVDGLVVSHRDMDHSGGADSLVAALPPGFLLSSLEPEHELLKKVPHSIACHEGQRWQWDGVSFEILHPQAEALGEPGRKINDQGCVLKITAQNHALLLPADIEARSERELLERNPSSLAAEILIAPHHGSKTSSTPEFIQAVAPHWVIYTVGYRNRFGHPKPEIEARYGERNVIPLRTDREGDVQVRVEQNHLTVSGWRQSHRHYWDDCSYCSPGR
jgi:competence protein ComEC